jgi:hypothetical protein
VASSFLLDKENSMTLYELTQPVVFQRPTRWQAHLRYAMPFPDSGGSVSLPVDTWLLALTEPTGKAGEYHCRCTEGAVVARNESLTAAEAVPVANPEAMRAVAAYRPLEQIIREDWGVNLEHVSPYAPFRLINCPLCSGTEFTSLDLAETWCDSCNANFSVRYTAVDPGFVVDCHWSHYYANKAHYCWLLKPESGYDEVIAYPVWLVVTAAEPVSDSDLPGWRVVRDNICPYCGQDVTPEHLADTNRWGPHHACRKLWRQAGWRPLIQVAEAVRSA